MNGGVGEVTAAPAGTLPPLEWKFSQVFGERTAGEEVQEVDIISAIEFDKSGDHLATGDRGGRVVLFERTDTKEHGGTRKDLERIDYPVSRHPEFRYKTEFQSHEPEFDYLKSLEIEEKINKIRWCQTANGALFLLSTNDKTIKFWKVQEKKVKKISQMNMDFAKGIGNGNIASSSISSSQSSYLTNGGCMDTSFSKPSNEFSFPPGGVSSLRLPVVTSNETSLTARCRRVYAHAHDYHINSISSNRCNNFRDIIFAAMLILSFSGLMSYHAFTNNYSFFHEQSSVKLFPSILDDRIKCGELLIFIQGKLPVCMNRLSEIYRTHV